MADFQGYVLLFLIWLLSTLLSRAIFKKTRVKSRLPPSPPALPIIGHLHLLGRIPHQAFHKLSNRYGPLIHLFLGSVPYVVASSPEMAKELLKTHETSFCNRTANIATDYLTFGSADMAFAPYGPYWKFIKKLCMSELLGGRTLDHLLPIRSEDINRFLRLMLKKAEISEAVDVGDELITLTNNIVSRMAMSKRCSDSEDEAHQGFGRSLMEVRDSFDAMMEKIIREREKARTTKELPGDCGVKDLLDILLDISEDESSEMRLTRVNIKTFILDIFSAGTDTSASAIEWALAELINHPKVMEKARQEIDSVIGRSRLVKESDISNFPYLQAIVKETLRLHPPSQLIMRESTENCVISGYEIPAKTKVFVNVWALGRDTKHWENALDFRPERFISKEGNGKNQLDVRGQNFQLLPFGSGRKGCPGTSLALQVVQTTLAAMIQCFEWKVGDGEDNIVDMEQAPGALLPRAHPLICVPVSRLNPFPSI